MSREKMPNARKPTYCSENKGKSCMPWDAKYIQLSYIIKIPFHVSFEFVTPRFLKVNMQPMYFSPSIN
jgi:hypothetical protein